MDLRYYIQVMWRGWWLLLLAPVAAGAVAFLVSEAQTDIYKAETTLLVNQTQIPGATQYSDILASDRLLFTYSELVKQRPILTAVIQELNLPYDEVTFVEDILGVEPVEETQLIIVSIKDPNPVQAATIANLLVDKFVKNNVAELGRPGTVSVTAPAVPPAKRAEPLVLLFTALAVGLGLLIGFGTVLLLENLDDTIKRADEVRTAGLSALAAVSRFKGVHGPRGGAPLVATGSWQSLWSEEYRFLRTNIQFLLASQPCKALLVTSGKPREGKSTTAANLAVVMAQAGLRTVLVDADLRRPALHTSFNLANSRGLVTILLGEAQDISEVLQETGLQNLAVIPSGPLPENPTELLASSGMAEFVADVSKLADIVIIDSPPLHPTADASILAKLAGGTILVVEAGKSNAQAVHRSVETLGRPKALVLGAVLNKVSDRTDHQYRPYLRANGAFHLGDELLKLSNGAHKDVQRAP